MVRGIRVFVGVTLALINLGSMLSTPLIYLDYELRKDYIAKVLCIEREKPITACNGKCYLNTRLEAALPDGTEEELPVTLQEIRLSRLDVQQPTPEQPHHWFERNTSRTFHTYYYSFLSVTDILHPPQQGPTA